MNKEALRKRRKVLKALVEQEGPSDQKWLLAEMRKKGIVTTQATISRDLQDMGFVKVRIAPGVYKYELYDQAARGGLLDRLAVLFGSFVVDIKGTGQLLLIRTSPGNANGVASLIDSLQKKEILGTIAGDDTILIVTSGEDKRKDIERDFKKLL
jgi:transcriptional regulator of arginine metabolism